MYISELAIHGFKSFANKERLSFGEGVTAVVGPNGCGKTNIVDAVRWVLGEQKTSLLRADTGCLKAFSPDLYCDIQRAGNLKSMFFAGEG